MRRFKIEPTIKIIKKYFVEWQNKKVTQKEKIYQSKKSKELLEKNFFILIVKQSQLLFKQFLIKVKMLLF